MAKTRKVMDVAAGDKHFAIILQEGTENPYCVYRYEMKWRGAYWSESRRLLQRFQSMRTALLFIADQY